MAGQWERINNICHNFGLRNNADYSGLDLKRSETYLSCCVYVQIYLWMTTNYQHKSFHLEYSLHSKRLGGFICRRFYFSVVQRYNFTRLKTFVSINFHWLICHQAKILSPCTIKIFYWVKFLYVLSLPNNAFWKKKQQNPNFYG